MLLLSFLAAATDGSTNWLAVVALFTLVSGGVSVITLIRLVTGKGGERQIEPTQIAAIQAELKAQTTTLTNINREVGITSQSVTSLAAAVDHLRGVQRQDVDQIHTRVNAISRDLAGVAARVDGLEKREPKPRT